MKLLSCSITTTGNCRSSNEDNYYINGHICLKENSAYEIYENECENIGIYAVCDGMGGYSNGDVASRICVEVLKEYQDKDMDAIIDEYVSAANKKVCDFIDLNKGAKCGSTLALLYINDLNASVYNVGDSRVYLFENDRLTQLSTDHTHAQRMINIGLLNEEQAKFDPGKHVLTQHIGITEDELVIVPEESDKILLSSGYRFLICSDGVTDMVDDNEIARIMSEKDSDSSIICRQLVQTALDNGGKDNITAIVVEVC